MPKAIVTGATGFIGRHLCRQLVAEGWRVQAAHRSSSSEASLSRLREAGIETAVISTPADIRELVEGSQPDVVFHLAAHQSIQYSPSEVSLFVEANIELGTQLLEGAVGSDCVVVNTASYFQFRDGESTSHSLYAATKQALIDVASYYRSERGVDVRHVVLYDSHGPGDTRNKLVPQLFDAVHNTTPISLGPANQTVNLLYIDDIVNGLIAASRPRNPEFMAVKSAKPTTVAEIVSEIELLSKATLDKTFDNLREPTDIVERSGNWPTPIDWQPQWTLTEGLRANFLTSMSSD